MLTCKNIQDLKEKCADGFIAPTFSTRSGVIPSKIPATISSRNAIVDEMPQILRE